MPDVHTLFIGLGGAEFSGLHEPPSSSGSALAKLRDRFETRLRETPLMFLERLPLESRSAQQLQWVELRGLGAGLIYVWGESPEPGVQGLVLRGRSGDAETVAKYAPALADYQMTIARSPRPLMVLGYATRALMENKVILAGVSAIGQAYAIASDGAGGH